jgi:hypothetical protein
VHRVLLLEEAQPIRMGFPLALIALGHDVARAHRIDPDPVRPILSRQLMRQSDNRRLDGLVYEPARRYQEPCTDEMLIILPPPA